MFTPPNFAVCRRLFRGLLAAEPETMAENSYSLQTDLASDFDIKPRSR